MVEGLELTEVASACGCSLATAKRRIAAADVVVRAHVGPPEGRRTRHEPARVPAQGQAARSGRRATLSRIWQGIDDRFPRPRRRTPHASLVVAPWSRRPPRRSCWWRLPAPRSGAAASRRTATRSSRSTRRRRACDLRCPTARTSSWRRARASSRSSRRAPASSRCWSAGSASFDVRPGGPRRWQIECGLATVEVVGTRFSCERSAGSAARRASQRGAGAGARRARPRSRPPAGRGRVARGRRRDGRRRPPRRAAGRARGRGGARPATAPAPDRAHRGPAPAVTRSRRLARAGAARATPGGVRDARHAGPSARGAAPRRRGSVRARRRRAAVRPPGGGGRARSSASSTDFASDPQAPLAAFALGRLELDSLARPARAVAALNKALALGAPQSLREDVRARLVEAYVRAGDQAAARSAADAYRREFPDGRYTKTIASLLGS